MISIEHAKSLVKNHVKPLLKDSIKPVEKAGNYLIFSDISSPINMPPFRQSAMDGYALCLYHDLTYNLIGEVKAGDTHKPTLKPGEAVRIFTGAPVPDSANAVIMQEKVTIKNNIITLEEQVNTGDNIRPVGEQVEKESIALKKATKLTPAAIGYLLSLGITTVKVFKKPSIAIVSTGNELIEPGEDLTYGKIYESNSKMLLSALYNLKFYDVTIYKVEDDYLETVKTLKGALSNNDLLLITGGISVGDYDFVGKALNELHVNEIFYEVKQKPGKPLYFGQKDDTNIFALPGNPAAALTCFYVYVYMALQKMAHHDSLELPYIQALSKSSFKKRGDRPQFLKAVFNNGEVTILEGQNSSMLQTYAVSNALVFSPEHQTEITIGTPVETILLPV